MTYRWKPKSGPIDALCACLKNAEDRYHIMCECEVYEDIRAKHIPEADKLRQHDFIQYFLQTEDDQSRTKRAYLFWKDAIKIRNGT